MIRVWLAWLADGWIDDLVSMRMVSLGCRCFRFGPLCARVSCLLRRSGGQKPFIRNVCVSLIPPSYLAGFLEGMEFGILDKIADGGIVR